MDYKTIIKMYNRMRQKEKIKFLVNSLKYHCNKYYGQDGAEISDSDFDKLESILKNEDSTNNYFNYPRSSFVIDSPWKKSKHLNYMASLDKVHTVQEVIKNLVDKFNVKELLAQDKMDGYAIEIIYKNGKLEKAITRGDGEYGEDITRNVVKMKNVKLKIPKEINNLKGEVILKSSDLIKLNKLEGINYENERNAGAIAKRLDGTLCEYLTVIYYAADIDKEFDTEYDKVEYISKIVEIANNEIVKVKDLEKFYLDYQNNRRQKLDYLIDGLVLKINDIKIQNKFDKHGKNPSTQRAWKFENQSGISIVEDIVWQIYTGSRVNPVALLKPFKLGGITISRATLNNPEWIEINDIHIGDKVLVERKNDVIPAIVEVIEKNKKGNTFEFPKECPECKSILERDGKFLLCVNEECRAKEIGLLCNWRSTLEVEDVGYERINLMYDAGLLKTPADFYRLKVNDIAQLERMGVKSATNITEQFIDKEMDLITFLTGLDISTISYKIIKKIVDEGYDTLNKILSANINEFCKVSGIAEITATKFVKGLKAREKIIEDLLKVGIKITEIEDTTVSNKLEGKSFCLTGSLSKSRPEIEQMIIDNLGTIKGVSSKLDYLLVGDSPGSKLNKAESLGIKIIDEDQLYKMLK